MNLLNSILFVFAFFLTKVKQLTLSLKMNDHDCLFGGVSDKNLLL